MNDLRGPARAIADLSRWRATALAFCLGALAGLGQVPFGLWPMMPAGLAGLCVLTALSDTGRGAFVRGLAGGAGHFALTLHWIVEPFLVDVARHGWMAPFALILFAGGLALFWAAAALVSHRAASTVAMRAVAFAPALVLAEALRGTVLTGFPWAFPGHALIDTPWLGLASWGGAHALTSVVLAAASLVAVGWLAGRGVASLVLAAGVLALPFALGRPVALPGGPDAPVVRLIQPNAPQHLKWRPDMIPVFWQRGRDLTAAPADPSAPPKLVVWPETSLPVLLGRSDAARAQLAMAAGDAPVLIGAQRFEGLHARNSLALVAPDGRLESLYDKHHLVPFGEYLPFAGLAERLNLRALAAVLPGGYGPGPGPAVFDLGPDLGRAFPMICYEAIFPGYIRDLAERPDWMVHVTNDAWFGTFSGPWQHLALARLRAAEQGLPVLRAANTGISALIDARGAVLGALPLGEAGYLDVRLPPSLPPTIYARFGDAPVLGLAIVALLGLRATGRREKGH